MNKNVLLISLGLLMCFASHAQVETDITKSASFQSKTINQIFSELESLYDVKIYANDDDQFNKPYSASFEGETLAEVLEKLLVPTTYSYINYRDYAWVIVPRTLMQESFSSEFYEALEENLSDNKPKRSILQIGSMGNLSSTGIATVTGIVSDVQTGEPIIGASVEFPDANVGTVTDIDGSFSLQVPAGEHELLAGSLGFAEFFKKVVVQSDGSIDITLDKGAVELEGVTIKGRAADEKISGAQIGVTSIDIKSIEKLPSFMGEVDLMKTFLLQPGVSSIGEGASGFNVRGGNVDQNLILQDQAELFNTSHALGFFSTFNTDLVKKVDLYKANVPAKYGGRLVSVMNVEMRDGDFDSFKINGGVGPVSSKISIEGPIISEKVSFIAGFRSAYTDWLLKSIQNNEVQNSNAFFYDANARLTIKPNEKNTITFSGYTSTDEFGYNQEFGFEYKSTFAELNYKTILTDKIFSDFSIVGSKYDSRQFEYAGTEASTIDNNVDYIKATESIKIVPNDQYEFNVGAQSIQYFVDPGAQNPLGENSIVASTELAQQKGRESAAFADATFNFGEAFTLIAGTRFVLYQFLGPHEEFQYLNPEAPRERETTGSLLKEGTIATYTNIEPRVSARLKLSKTSALKAGYSRTSQFINQIFNSDTPTPSSIWQLSTNYIKPVKSHNLSLGVFKNIKNNSWETSLEFYARQIDELYDYVDFATLLINDQLETDLRYGEGRAYGAEVSIKKNVGQLNGWLSYTYAKSERKIPEINNGEWYLSNFDKTHDVSFIFNYEPNQRNTLTANLNYSTGRPTTPPLGNFTTSTGVLVPVFATRSSQRIPNYMRLDLAYTLGQGYKKDQKFRTSWTLSLYNVLGRRNAFSVYYTRAPFEGVQANKLSVLGNIFPSLTVNFELL